MVASRKLVTALNCIYDVDPYVLFQAQLLCYDWLAGNFTEVCVLCLAWFDVGCALRV